MQGMVQQKIEAFLTQFKALDALSLSLVEDLKLNAVKMEALQSEKEVLKSEIQRLQAEVSDLKERLDQSHQVQEPKPKPKKVKTKIEPEAPTLF